jgi:hypothetical protein
MEVGSPSRTAILAAIHRATHFLIDNPPEILADSFARAFAGSSSEPSVFHCSLTVIRRSARVTVLSPRGVNATGRLRFLDPMAGRAHEKSVTFP